LEIHISPRVEESGCKEEEGEEKVEGAFGFHHIAVKSGG
jgi:hypothetical protein